MAMTTVFLAFGGLYYQTASDTVFPTYIFGIYSGGSNALPDTFGCFSGISKCFNLLYQHGVGTDIYDWFQFISVFFCSAYWSYHLIRSRIALWLMIPVVASLLDPFMPFEFSKTSMLLSVTGLHIIHSDGRLLAYIFGICLFSLGFLVRPEPVIICMILFFAATLLHLRSSLKPLKTLALPVLAVMVLSAVFLNSSRTKEDIYYREFRKYEYTLVDFRKGQIDDVQLNPVDKMKLQAAQGFFFADREALNTSFFKEIGIQPLDKTPVSLLRAFWKTEWTYDGLSRFTTGIFNLKFHFLCLLLTGLLLWNKNRAKVLVLTMALLLIVGFSVFLKTENHFISSSMMTTFLLIGVLKDRIPDGSESENRSTPVFILVRMLFASLLMIVEKVQLVSASKRTSEYYNSVQDKLEHLNPETLVYNISYWDKLHYRLFSPVQPEGSYKATVIDGGALYLNEDYQGLMSDRTGRSRFEDQFLYLVEEGRFFVSSQKRMSLMTDYMNVVHGLGLQYETLMMFPSNDSTLNSKSIGIHKFSLHRSGKDEQ